MRYEAHPAAAIFPMMDAERLAELAADIKANGLKEPIRLYGGMVLDGRNRLEACRIAEVAPRFEHVAEGESPWAAAWSFNGQRRDLSTDQRYLLWAECSGNDEAWQAEQQRARDEANAARAAATKERERKPDGTLTSRATTCGTTGQEASADGDEVRGTTKTTSPKKPARSTDRKAKTANVDRGTVERNDWLSKHRPDLHERVKAGDMTSSKAVSTAKKEAREVEIQKQREAIASGEADLPDGLFEVVVMDPPWNYGREYDPETSRVANPYPEMTQEELLAMEPPFASDAALFLWTTHQFIWDAKALMDRWGFTYKAALVWDKEKMGMGAWLRMQCEFCLIGVRGKPTWDNSSWRDIIREPRREHSRKPETFYRMVEAVTVGRRLDFFSREARDGWESFGNDTSKF